MTQDKKFKVLLFNDNKDFIADYVAALSKQKDIEILIARNLKEADEIMNGPIKIDILVSDLVVPIEGFRDHSESWDNDHIARVTSKWVNECLESGVKVVVTSDNTGMHHAPIVDGFKAHEVAQWVKNKVKELQGGKPDFEAEERFRMAAIERQQVTREKDNVVRKKIARIRDDENLHALNHLVDTPEYIASHTQRLDQRKSDEENWYPPHPDGGKER